MRFRAQLQSMADSEIKAMIPPYLFEDIKRRDPKPLFKAFVVGQEGESEGKLVGVGKIVKTWFKDAIGKLSRKIYPGLKLFHQHAETNVQEGRVEIGEVAGSRTQTIKGKFSAMIAAYIYPEYKSLPLDVASIEADININNDVSGAIHAIDVDEVTGIALGSSAVDTPGFPGATLQGELQAFLNSQSQFNQGGGDMPTLEEVKKFVSEEGIDPSEVFGRDQLIDDPVVKGYVKAEVKEATTGEYAHRKRTDDKFTDERKKWEDEKATMEKENKELKAEGAKTKAADLFSKKAKDRKLDEKQIEFIEARRGSWVIEDPEALDKEVDALMDKALEDFKTEAKIFGHEIEEEKKETDATGPGSEESGDASHIPD